jgi:ubiquinone/menaquinone biosynthesis C-methylase UbiE
MPKKIEWSDKTWKEIIIEQRKRMWLPDTVKKLAKWLNLKPGMMVADIGCGLGYLGWTYWKYFGNNGSYTGVDLSEKLIKEAKDISEEWANGGKAYFQTGDAYKLDLKDNSFDAVMCQTLLMHLENPEKAISEMFRILKPSGTILCKEPDNYSNSLMQGFSTLPDITLEEQLIIHKIRFYYIKGRKKLKRGDAAIGIILPMLLHKAGFINIDIRNNDKATYMIPPYEQDFQKLAVKNLHKRKSKNSISEQKFWRNRMKEEVIAGGGTAYLLRKYYSLYDRRAERNRKKAKKQIKNAEFFSCYGPGMFYAVKGTKGK